jgi:hypothetical protein
MISSFSFDPWFYLSFHSLAVKDGRIRQTLGESCHVEQKYNTLIYAL